MRLCRQDDDASLRLLAFGLAAQPGGGHRVVHDLPLEGCHCLEACRLPGALDLFGCLAAEITEHRPAPGAISGDVEHQPGPVNGPGQDRQPGQLLQRFQDDTLGADQMFQVAAHHRDGGAVPLDFSLFAEYLPTRNRGRWLVILESFWGVGTVVAAGLAWILVPTLGWRYLLGSSALAGALVFWVRLRIPESPRFLAATGRVDEAEAILGQVAP